MSALTEENIVDIVYALYETDTTGWETTSEEYLAARKYANVAIARWESYDNTTWRELWGTLDAAADGDKTLTAGDYSYDCPTNFKRPGSWVRTGATPTYWEVIPPEKVADIGAKTGKWCWFSGNVKTGFDLNFNPNETLTTSDAIDYEYYKTASTFTATTSTTELSDPYFIVYYILYRFLKNDGEDYTDEANQAEDLLENMRVINMSGYQGIPNGVGEPITSNYGFGD